MLLQPGRIQFCGLPTVFCSMADSDPDITDELLNSDGDEELNKEPHDS